METVIILGLGLGVGWSITTVIYLIVERLNGDL
mgnify:CR=1 FL=1